MYFTFLCIAWSNILCYHYCIFIVVTKTRLGVLKRQVQSLIAHQVTLYDPSLLKKIIKLFRNPFLYFSNLTTRLLRNSPPPHPLLCKKLWRPLDLYESKYYKHVKVEKLRLVELWFCLPFLFQASWSILKICSTITSRDRQLVGGMCGECVQYFLTWQCSIVKEFFKGLFTWYRNDFHSGTSSFHLLIFTKTTLTSCTSHSGMRSRRFSIRNSCSGTTFTLVACKLKTNFVPDWKSQIV